MGKAAVSLQRLIYRNYLRSALSQMLVIEVVLLLLYFSINQYISERNQAVLLQEVTHNLHTVVLKQAKSTSLQLEEISRLARILQQDHTEFFAHPEPCFLPHGEPELRVHDNGAYYKAVDNGGGSLYYAATTIIGNQEQQKARCSERMDSLLKAIVTTNSMVTQVYFNSADAMNRIYPFMTDAAARFGASWDVNDLAFYFLADAHHNPQRQPVWTNAYFDPAGQGWVMSCIVPIYRGDVLEGVSGIDITINNLIQNILQLELSWNAGAILVDQTGAILAMPPQVERILGIQSAPALQYQEPIITTLAPSQEYNLLKSTEPTIRTQLQSLFNTGQAMAELHIGDNTYFMLQTVVPETGWRLFVLVAQAEVFAPIDALHATSNRIGYIAIGVMISFYIIFFVLLLIIVRRLANKIVTPIHLLSEATADFERWRRCNHHAHEVGIIELDRLNTNFNNMVNTLELRTDQLATAESCAQLQEKLATTDLLTELYNRRKIETVLAEVLVRADRYAESCGVIICDLDYFKAVNDQYGHLVGDQVLTTAARCLKQNVRQTDVVGRWGGEEFLVVCIMVDAATIYMIAEKLRQALASTTFPVVGHKTASFGVALHRAGETQTALLARADEALYEAKNYGRNRVAIAP